MAKCLGIMDSELTSLAVMVRAYDDTRRAVLGSLDLDLFVGPGMFPANFQIIDIPSSFNLLLGRAWLHDVRVLSSSLHQKVKIPCKGEIISIKGDPERTMSQSEPPVLRIGSQSIQLGGFSNEPQVQTFTTQKVRYLPPDNIPGLSTKVTSMLRAMEYLPAAYLGRRQSRVLQSIEPVEKRGTEGLGYEPTEENMTNGY